MDEEEKMVATIALISEKTTLELMRGTFRTNERQALKRLEAASGIFTKGHWRGEARAYGNCASYLDGWIESINKDLGE